ncbi:penicillin-binding protein [Candidatus Saccharibacteria bacterium]|nr:penicillin-binding protein [Candidatus Saccharibacteria bacterium]MCB9821597.1 penicillin-binding protein [Candidatus Nomurabacteria bacterium]
MSKLKNVKTGFSKLFKNVKKRFQKVNKSRKTKKDARARKKAEYLATLPKGRVKRFLYRLHPKRVIKYWFSRQGAIMALKLTGIGIASMGLLIFSLFAYYRKDLPTNFSDLQACVQGQTTEYYDSTGKTLLWASKGNVECTPVSLKNVSKYLVDAVVATEDKDFYTHGGFKSSSVLRAAVANFTGGGRTQGGSTITQQYVKNAILKNTEKVYSRKIKELILSIELERSFTKDEILNAYLNVASFGSVYDGIEAASRGYFDKSASELTLDEAALLTAAIPSPTYYWSNPDVHVERQHYVLKLMREQNKITQEEYEQALEVDTLAKVITDRDQFEGIIAPHFVLEVEKRLIAEYGEEVRKLGFKVYTTLDLDAQALAQKSVDAAIPMLESRGMDNAAAVAVDVETGKVIAHVGSRDFRYPEFGQTNTVTTPRDPGSAFKIFDYSSVIENTTDWGAGSTFYDYRTTFAPGYTPKNYDGGHRGPVSMRYAFGQSLNIPAIKAMYIAGIEKTHDIAYKAGLRSGVNCGGYCGLASAIGSGVELRLDEMANSYATFGRLGNYQPLTYIDKIYDSNDQLISEWTPGPGEDVINPETAYIINNILSDPSVRFTQGFNISGVKMAIKTGTTDNFKNNTVFGYTKKVAFGAWMGHHDVTRSFNESYTTAIKTTMIQAFMKDFNSKLPEEQRNDWEKPEGVKYVRIDRTSGYQSDSGQADLFPSWYVPKRQDKSQTAEIDVVTGLRATECTPDRARQVVNGGNLLAELPESDPNYSAWMKPIIAALGPVVGGEIPKDEDDLHNCDDIRPSISFVSSPASCDGSCVITVKVTKGTHPLDTVNLKVDGQIIPGGSKNVTSNGNVDFYYTVAVDGNKRVTAEVVDSALYDASIDTNINFSISEPVLFDPIGNGVSFTGGPGPTYEVTVNWSKESSNLSIQFSGDCSGNVTLPSAGTSSSFNSSGKVNIGSEGNYCSANLYDDGILVDQDNSIYIPAT